MKYFRVYKNLVPFEIWDQRYKDTYVFIAGRMEGDKSNIEYIFLYSCKESAENAIKDYKQHGYIKGRDICSCGEWYKNTVKNTLCRMLKFKELKIVKQGRIGGKRNVL